MKMCCGLVVVDWNVSMEVKTQNAPISNLLLSQGRSLSGGMSQSGVGRENSA